MSLSIDHYLGQMRDETINRGIKYIILRLRRIRNPDVVAVEHLEHFLRDSQQQGVTVLLAAVRPNLAKILRNLHFDKWLPADRVYAEQEEVYSATLNAVRHACRFLNEDGTTKESEAVYYLV